MGENRKKGLLDVEQFARLLLGETEEEKQALTSLLEEEVEEGYGEYDVEGVEAPEPREIPGRVDPSSWTPPCPWHRGGYMAASVLLFRRAYRRRKGFGMLIDYGLQGAGKTIHTLLVAHEILCRIGRPKPWSRLVGDYLVFNPREIIDKVRSASAKKRLPVLIGDDWGIAGGGVRWVDERDWYIYLRDLMQVIRTRIAVLLVSTTNPALLAKALREQPDAYIAHVYPSGRNYSTVVYYELKVSPKGQIYVQRIARDYVWITLPDEAYNYYLKKRDSYVAQVLERSWR